MVLHATAQIHFIKPSVLSIRDEKHRIRQCTALRHDTDTTEHALLHCAVCTFVIIQYHTNCAGSRDLEVHANVFDSITIANLNNLHIRAAALYQLVDTKLNSSDNQMIVSVLLQAIFSDNL